MKLCKLRLTEKAKKDLQDLLLACIAVIVVIGTGGTITCMIGLATGETEGYFSIIGFVGYLALLGFVLHRLSNMFYCEKE